MATIILDCYTDEPSGLGVPPYLGTYPRYLFGALSDDDIYYLTIDDLRFLEGRRDSLHKTSKKIIHLTRSRKDTELILKKAKKIIVNLGVQTPGKYLSAEPGTLSEITKLLEPIKAQKILTGPAALGGTQLVGGKKFEKIHDGVFDEVDFNYLAINEFKKTSEIVVKGAKIISQIPYPVICEIETMKGCIRKIGCDFCTEPIKNSFFSRSEIDIVNEISALYKQGIKHFRLGKQTCFYTYQNYNPERIEKLLKGIWAVCPGINVLHIDNVNPTFVAGVHGEKITKLVAKYCTEGNVAAFGVESFDEKIVKLNNLNTTPEMTLKAIEIINKYGKDRGANGMPKYLPGLNIIFGLKGETKETHEKNMYWLKEIMNRNLLLRRINIRQLAVYEGTKIHKETGTKFVKKNKRHYWSWRKEIRTEIDNKMIKKLVPAGTVLKDIIMEIHDGKTTFGRQMGTYPLVIGIKNRLPLRTSYCVKVTDHMLRSITAEQNPINSSVSEVDLANPLGYAL